MVKDNSKKSRTERFYQVPLCENDCNNWFEACKDDFTCRDNWLKGFKWHEVGMNGEKVKRNFCPAYEKCETFKMKFKTASNFCNRIWDDEFKVSNSSQCITFNVKSGGSNEAVATEIFHQTYGNLNNGADNLIRPGFVGLMTCLIGFSFWL